METLEVYLNGRKAGRLVDDNGKMSFAYIREYLETDGREPISFSIPLRTEAFAHAYDVMSTAIYPEVGKRMAMKVDGEYAFKWITRGKFIRMADKLRFHPHIVNSAMDKMIHRVKLALPQLVAQATRRFPHRCYSAIADGIASRLSQLEA